MNTPNKLTLVRIFLIPVFLVLLYISFPWHRYVALFVFLVASLTDALDGHLARSRGQITDFGKFMDPLADKLLVIAAMLYFVEQWQMPAWVLLLVVTREFAVTALRLVAVEGGRVIAAGIAGKIKTVATMLGICVMLVPPLAAASLFGVTVNTVCVALILVTTLWSGLEYFLKNKDVINWKS
ncbi:MAG: CDP-diacylglycerol--glycerol-3-phosphate 3-phosphatidyltransferase [Oscillospiraceae bacterium]|jgi:CDP-diacylglycerol--glycerol-3-phosphate 3-phosphatidyltransferase